MNPITPLTGNPSSLASLDAATGPTSARVSGALQGLNLTILGATGEIEGPGTEIRVRLENPIIGPEDIPLNEFLQQLDAIGDAPMAPLVLDQAVAHLVEGTAAFARAIQADPPLDATTAADLAGKFEGQALAIEQSIRDLIENSTYPSFSDFLKELVRVAQELREMATKTKMAAIQANYEVMYQASEQMLVAATKAKESREKQIAAEKKEAIGQIVAGIASIAFCWCPPLAQGAMQLVNGAFSLSTSGLKTESSTLQFESDLANVAKQRLESAAKLIESQVQIADDLREIGKGLRDMVLKLYQDFISSQNQVIQRANV